MSRPTTPIQLTWHVSRPAVVRFLFTLAILFLLFSVVGQLLLARFPDSATWASIAQATNVDSEGNLPALFSSLLLLIPSVLAALIAYGRPGGTIRRGWWIIAVTFAYLATDEFMHMHELLMAPLRRILRVSGFLHFAWIIPYLILLVALLVILLRFLLILPTAIRNTFLLAGFLYVLGAAGLEIIGGKMTSLLGSHNEYVLPLTTIEEALEMTGAIIFIGALIDYLNLYDQPKKIGASFGAVNR